METPFVEEHGLYFCLQTNIKALKSKQHNFKTKVSPVRNKAELEFQTNFSNIFNEHFKNTLQNVPFILLVCGTTLSFGFFSSPKK